MSVVFGTEQGNLDSKVRPIQFTASQPVTSIAAEFAHPSGNAPCETVFDGTDANNVGGAFHWQYRYSTHVGNTWAIVRDGGWPAEVDLRIKEAAVGSIVLPPSGTPPLYAPIAQWPLDGAPDSSKLWFDRSGNGRHLTAGTATATADMVASRTAIIPGSVNANRLRRVVDPALQLRGELTISVRAKRAAGGGGVLVCMSALYAGTASKSLYVLNVGTSGALGSFLDGVPAIWTAAAMTSDAWHFGSLRRTADGAETLGIDGTYQDFASRGPIVGGTEDWLVIGDHEESAAGYFQGPMADVTIWDRRLTDAELEHVRLVTMGNQ